MQHEWQPIETAPKDGSWFLAYAADEQQMELVRWDGREWFGQTGIEISPTHWMPMPEPPQ